MKGSSAEGMNPQGGVVTRSCEEVTSKKSFHDCEYSWARAPLAALVMLISLGPAHGGLSLLTDAGREALPLALVADGDALGAGNL